MAITARKLGIFNPLLRLHLMWKQTCSQYKRHGISVELRRCHREQARSHRGYVRGSQTSPPNRPAGRPPRGAVLLICLPSREAERRFCGVGRPAWMPGEPRWAMDGPSRRAHGAEPERGYLSAAKAVRWGESAWVTLPLLQSDSL